LLKAPLAEQGWAPDGWPAIILMSLASAFVGCLLYRLVETPFMKLRDRYVPSNYAKPAPAQAVAA
jgi:peptidoglycan/LPS O-acetylase OafA/YrhL